MVKCKTAVSPVGTGFTAVLHYTIDMMSYNDINGVSAEQMPMISNIIFIAKVITFIQPRNKQSPETCWYFTSKMIWDILCILLNYDGIFGIKF